MDIGIPLVRDEIKQLKSRIEQLEVLIDNVYPKGGILLWSGNLLNIPKGFVLCDGQNGTPDLRGRFIMGCSEQYDVFTQGGSQQHNHNITVNSHQLTIEEMPKHRHKHGYMGYSSTNHLLYASGNNMGPYWSDIKSNGPDTSNQGDNQPHDHTAVCHNHSSLPPFIALAYIMKL